VRPPEEVHIEEGGDVVLWDDYILLEPIKGAIKVHYS
jgi:hypothetical protein